MATPAESGRRVLYLLTSDVSQVLVRGQLGFLLNRGWDVTVGVGDAGAASTAATWDDGVRVEFVPYVRQVSLLRDLRALWATIQLIRRVRPQLVNASTPKAGLLGMLAARVCRVPIRVYVIRGLRLETVSGLQRRVLHTTERVAVGCSTHLLANSDSVLELARSIGIVPAEVGEVIGAGSGNGVDVGRFTPATAEERSGARARLEIDDEVVIAFVGRLTHDKGVADLVAAFVSEFDGRDDVRLLLVGGFEAGDPLDPATRRIIDRDVRIDAHPWTTDPAEVYSAADLIAFPSYREGLPNVPLEAQASGLAVVGYAATGTVDAVVDGQTGVLVRTGDVVALGRSLATLVDDPDRRRLLGSGARRHVEEQFDRERVFEGLVTRYERWLAES